MCIHNISWQPPSESDSDDNSHYEWQEISSDLRGLNKMPDMMHTTTLHYEWQEISSDLRGLNKMPDMMHTTVWAWRY